MDWDELGSLAAAGWEVGSHTVSHPMLTRVGDEALAGELGESRAAVEAALGRPCRSLAYPYGDFDARVAEGARAAGYDAAGTLFPGRIPGAPALEWPRVAISHHHDLRAFRLKVSVPVRVVRSRSLPAPVARLVYRGRAVDPPPRPGKGSA
jgi:peptidoglycan/xylan/chitin deacetylase (PgdA/CDA1 family)